jgi:hypothetical protein
MSYGLAYTPYNTNLFAKTRVIDPAAQDFIDATGITGDVQQQAINNLVKGLKADGLWSKMKAVYPFVTDNRNLLSYTTTFNTSYYVSDSTSTFTLNSTTAPDGTNTGVKFTSVTSNNNYWYSANQANGQEFGTGNKAFSIYVKAGTFSGLGSIGITSDGSTIRTNFTLTNDWQRITLTRNVIVAGNGSQYYIDMNSLTMTSGQYFYIWAPQFENGTTATTYQPIATTQQAYIASQFKYNLVNPVDSDAAFRLVFNGGWTHSSTGATPNGTNGYADTKFNQATYLTQTNGEIGSYLRTNTTGTYVDMGCHFAGSDYALITKLADNNFYGRIATLDINSNYQPATTLGLFAVRANGTNSAKFTRNGTTQATKATSTFAIESLNIGIGSAINNTGGIYFSPRQTAFNYISDSLTDTEASNLYSRVQQFQVSLSRNV